jgi:hypothetical protein
MLRYILLTTTLVVMVFVAALRWGLYAWQRDTAQCRLSLGLLKSMPAGHIGPERELAGVPAALQRDLRKVLPHHTARILMIQMRIR